MVVFIKNLPKYLLLRTKCVIFAKFVGNEFPNNVFFPSYGYEIYID